MPIVLKSSVLHDFSTKVSCVTGEVAEDLMLPMENVCLWVQSWHLKQKEHAQVCILER